MYYRIKKIFFFTFWAPVFLSFCYWVYLKNLNGWAAWAAAPIMIIPFTFSAIYTFIGIILIAHSVNRKNFSFKLTTAVLFAGLPILVVFARMIILEIQRSF